MLTKIKNHFPALFLLCASTGFSPLVTVAQAQCNAYPIAVSAASLVNATNGTVVSNIFNGSQPGGAGWLTWTGDTSDGALVTSLTAPGNSDSYVNPFNPSDHNLQVGDWVQSKPGVNDSSGVRNALANLETSQITVPVWDIAACQGANAVYHITAFAIVQIVSYDIPGKSITAVFLGYTSCNRNPS